MADVDNIKLDKILDDPSYLREILDGIDEEKDTATLVREFNRGNKKRKEYAKTYMRKYQKKDKMVDYRKRYYNHLDVRTKRKNYEKTRYKKKQEELVLKSGVLLTELQQAVEKINKQKQQLEGLIKKYGSGKNKDLKAKLKIVNKILEMHEQMNKTNIGGK